MGESFGGRTKLWEVTPVFQWDWKSCCKAWNFDFLFGLALVPHHFLALTHPLPPPLRMFPHLQNEGVVLDRISGPFKFEKVMILPPCHPLTSPLGLLIDSEKMRKNVCSMAPAPNRA